MTKTITINDFVYSVVSRKRLEMMKEATEEYLYDWKESIENVLEFYINEEENVTSFNSMLGKYASVISTLFRISHMTVEEFAKYELSSFSVVDEGIKNYLKDALEDV